MRLLHYINIKGLVCLSEENIVEVGCITHFFSKINVAVVELTAPLVVGDRILIKGPSTDFEQAVESMQIEHKNIQRAEAGQSIGLKLAQRVKEKDTVYKKL
jgi:putative protease